MIGNNSKRLGDRIEERDMATVQWAKLTKKMLLAELLKLGITDKIKLAKEVTRIRRNKGENGSVRLSKEEFLTKSLAYRLRKKEGELENVAFSFARHGIFLEHGVGRGRKKGSASASKHKQPWLEPLLPSRIEALASILAEKYADIAAEELRIIIPGVFESKVKI